MKKIIIILLSLFLLILPVAGCTQNNGGKTKIRLNEVTHSIFYAPQYLAIALGYFDEENIEIELTNGGGADASMTAILSGTADIGLLGPEAAIYVSAQGRTDYPVIFCQLTKRDGSFLMGRTEDSDFDYSKLTGKEVIAGRRGGVPAMTLQYVLNNHGLINGQNITLNYDVQFNLMGPAFEGGTGDFVTLFEPVASNMQTAGKGYILTSIGKDSGEVPYTAYQAEKSYITDNPETIKAFIRAIYKAQQVIITMNAADIAEKILPYFEGSTLSSITAAVKSYQDIDAWMSTPVMTNESFDRLQDIMENAGELSSRADFEKLVDNTYAQEIINAV